ncbi:MAG: TIGR03084 family protein [Propionibacteriales bacterium]|nr:TIGR03084 family protein [Propionibacteriales bacterium]
MDQRVTLLDELLADLTAETDDLTGFLARLDIADWERPTPATGWQIRDQVSHLAYFDEAATLAATDAQRFRAEADELTALGPDFPDKVAGRYRDVQPDELVSWFRRARAALVDTLRARAPRDRVPWYGPEMSITSSATARLMETWAHGQDIVDALSVAREGTKRLRHVAHLGVSTMGFAFGLRGRPVPEAEVHVALTAPDGSTWPWGPEGAENSVSGPALDFCLVVTQRRHHTDTNLRVVGPVAADWMSIAQAFAGAPGPGREPGQFPKPDRGAP